MGFRRARSRAAWAGRCRLAGDGDEGREWVSLKRSRTRREHAGVGRSGSCKSVHAARAQRLYGRHRATHCRHAVTRDSHYSISQEQQIGFILEGSIVYKTPIFEEGGMLNEIYKM